MNKPVAVLISDVHYNINTLEVADKAVRLAISKANELSVPLVVAGDLHDTKANLRGECIKTMLDTFRTCKQKPWILVGNHDKINEKSKDHSLHFLDSCANIVDTVLFTEVGWLIPYYSDTDELRREVDFIRALIKIGGNYPKPLIMHQGLANSNSGHYIQDKSAINKEDVKDFRVISGHYHQKQDIKTGRARKGAVGLWSYLGNPYTLGFGEANDPEKGFHVLHDNGLLEFVPTNLRKHIILQCSIVGTEVSIPSTTHVREDDIVWVKVSGARESLNNHIVSKNSLSVFLQLKQDFKLELIPNDVRVNIDIKSISQSQPELLDNLISTLTNVSNEQKDRLKTIWKDLCE